MSHNEITLKRIFWFWVPLAVMWLIMSVEQPSITAVVSRLPDETRNLAAFGLTFSLALITESPVIMLLTAGTALATHAQSYRRLLNFTHILSIVLTLLHLLLAITPAYNYILRDLIGAPEEIIETSRIAFLWMLLWTPMIAYRRLFEGVMIRYGHPQRLTIVIIVRLSATVLVLLAGLALRQWPGAYVGGAALSVGVTAGAVTAWFLSRPIVRAHLSEPKPGATPLTWSRLLSFYTPLALTSLITLVGMPIFSFGLSRAPLPIRSLAVWPVITALLFIGRSLGVAYQEVVVTLLQDASSYQALRRFTWLLAGTASGAFALLALTPGAAIWYRYISGLDPELVQMAILPTLILAPVPGLNALLSWQRGLLVASGSTGLISLAVALNMMILLFMMLLGPYPATIPGAVWAAIALTLSLGIEALYLGWRSRTASSRLASGVAVAAD